LWSANASNVNLLSTLWSEEKSVEISEMNFDKSEKDTY